MLIITPTQTPQTSPLTNDSRSQQKRPADDLALVRLFVSFPVVMTTVSTSKTAAKNRRQRGFVLPQSPPKHAKEPEEEGGGDGEADPRQIGGHQRRKQDGGVRFAHVDQRAAIGEDQHGRQEEEE